MERYLIFSGLSKSILNEIVASVFFYVDNENGGVTT